MKTIKAKVYRLPTGKSVMLDGALETDNPAEADSVTQSYHLYITTDEGIKKGDWMWHKDLKSVMQSGKDLPKYNQNTFNKIIATTDPKLTIEVRKELLVGSTTVPRLLPQIPQSFIEEYCKASDTDEVLVEVEVLVYPTNMPKEGEERPPYRLKLTPDNCIIIHPVEEKMYSREEVIDLLHKMHRMVFNLSAVGDPCGESKRDKWIEENL